MERWYAFRIQRDIPQRRYPVRCHVSTDLSRMWFVDGEDQPGGFPVAGTIAAIAYVLKSTMKPSFETL